MEDCVTPTIASPSFFAGCNNCVTMFPFPNVTELQNLNVEVMNPRCYTPTLNDFKSPGLSPIFDLGERAPDNTSTAQKTESFKLPLKIVRKKSNDAKLSQPQQQQLQQKTPQQSPQIRKEQPTPPSSASSTPSSSSSSSLANNISFTMNSSKPLTSTPGSNPGDTPKTAVGAADKSRSFILNATLEITTALSSIGLQLYSSVFEDAGIDFQGFLSITLSDLLKMGIKDEEHTTRILELLHDLNRSFT